VTDAVSLEAGYLLHYTQYGDANFIVDFFSLNHGRVSLMAKGARSSKPRTRALYQPFQPLLVSWWGNHELRTLTGIEESGKALVLQGMALPCGYYLNEIMIRLLAKDQPYQNLFAHYALSLSELAEADSGPEAVLRRFELQLLETLGLLPDFAHVRNDGESLQADEHYLFYPGSSQAVLVPNEDNHIAIPKTRQSEAVFHPDGETLDVGVPLSGRTLLALAEFDIEDAAVLKEIKPLMRRLLRAHLGDKPLNSRELFSSLTPPPPPPRRTSTENPTDPPSAGTAADPSANPSANPSADPSTNMESSERD